MSVAPPVEALFLSPSPSAVALAAVALAAVAPVVAVAAAVLVAAAARAVASPFSVFLFPFEPCAPAFVRFETAAWAARQPVAVALEALQQAGRSEPFGAAELAGGQGRVHVQGIRIAGEGLATAACSGLVIWPAGQPEPVGAVAWPMVAAEAAQEVVVVQVPVQWELHSRRVVLDQVGQHPSLLGSTRCVARC